MVDAPRFSAGSTNSFPRPAVAPSATRRFVSAGRAAQSRSCSRVSGSTFTPRHPRSANAAVDRIQYGIAGADVHPEAPRSSGRRARASTTSSWFCAYDTNGPRLTCRLRHRSGRHTVRRTPPPPPPWSRRVRRVEGGVAQFGHGSSLELSDSLWGEVEVLADLFKGAGFAAIEPEAQRQDLAFARR